MEGKGSEPLPLSDLRVFKLEKLAFTINVINVFSKTV